ncbi:MAG: porin family protein [bacterium]
MLKKILIGTALCLGLVFVAQINSSADEDILNSSSMPQVGLKIGGNYSNVWDAEGEEFNSDPKLGLVIGGWVSVPLGPMIGVQPEIHFSQRGFLATGKLLGTAYKFTRTSSFLDIPLLFAIKPIPMLTLLIGPQYSFLLSQKNEFANGTTTIDQEKAFDNENYRKNILCFVLGGDVNLGHTVLGARAGFDFINNNGDGTQTTPRYKNVWFQATLGFRL